MSVFCNPSSSTLARQFLTHTLLHTLSRLFSHTLAHTLSFSHPPPPSRSLLLPLSRARALSLALTLSPPPYLSVSPSPSPALSRSPCFSLSRALYNSHTHMQCTLAQIATDKSVFCNRFSSTCNSLHTCSVPWCR